MKAKLIIGATVAAGAVFLISYFAQKRKSLKHIGEPLPIKKSHHLTDVFARAKHQPV